MLKGCIDPIAVDLFCGAGGLSKGLINSGIKVKCAVEIDKTAASTYTNNIGDIVIVDDIRNVKSESILERININKGELFLLAGCPPCQTFSSLQKHKKDNDERDELVFEFVRIVNEIEPMFVLMENVPGMSRGRGKEIFRKAVDKLNEKYHTYNTIVNCADYGVPQQRKRLVLHAIRKDIFCEYFEGKDNYELNFPAKTHTDNKDKHPELLEWKTASVIRGLPPIKAGEKCDESTGIFNHETNNLSEKNIERIQYIRANGGSRSCLPERLRLECHSKENVGYSGVYGIMKYEEPSPTITGGCICYSKGRFGHPEQDRAISVREAARLQTFGDDFRFFGSRGQTALQVGNAVPPLLAEVSGRYFLKFLNYINSEIQSDTF